MSSSSTKVAEVLQSGPQDAALLAPRLRRADLDEIQASSGRDPWEALCEGYLNSERCLTVWYNGLPAAMFGIMPTPPHNPGWGTIWLLGSDDIGEFAPQFLRESSAHLRALTEGYEEVGNWVDSRNRVHLRWLAWLGFDEKAKTTSPSGVDFVFMTKTIEPHV